MKSKVESNVYKIISVPASTGLPKQLRRTGEFVAQVVSGQTFGDQAPGESVVDVLGAANWHSPVCNSSLRDKLARAVRVMIGVKVLFYLNLMCPDPEFFWTTLGFMAG